MSEIDDQQTVVQTLHRLGLASADETPRLKRLTGGVSSDIWRVDLQRGSVCVKRALPKLRVAADWRAPIERNAYEAAWMRIAGAVASSAVPELIGEDAASGTLVMAYLSPDAYRLWKEELRQGRAERQVAHAVGERLVRIHAATAGDAEIAEAFPTDAIFYDIRLEPYLIATAEQHPEVADALRALATTTAATKCALVHGDVSPKNILIGPNGPVFLDAECAWYGDPAFDLAFCLNHLLLKCLLRPAASKAFLDCFDGLAASYLAGVSWENATKLEARAARLLPGLFLGRVDGKSPVEYVTETRDKDRVRRVACRLLVDPVDRLHPIRATWLEELQR